MRSLLVFIFFVLLLFFCSKCNAQLGVFKYSTIYASAGFNQVLDEVNTYTIQNGILTETTKDNKYNYRYALGIRRLARLSMENRKSYKDGTETELGKFRSALMNGLEYLVSYENVRDRGINYINQDYFIRYISKNYIIKLQSTNLQGIDLKYRELDLRLKKDVKDFQLSLGISYRLHPAYSINPFSIFSGSDYIEVANNLGYNSEYYYLDMNSNGYLDRFEISDYYWFNSDGDTIANSNTEFMQYHYSDIVNTYNNNEINKLGIQHTISSVIGINYYKHNNNNHYLLWTNILPYHYKLTKHGYNGSVDYEIGAIIQRPINKFLSVFTEGVYLKYLDRRNYNIKIGLNILLK
tara:strand:+ start:20214 stop:21266 length:1053 start_codon:yes stop_codon:yes gene_type:complete